MHDHAFLTGRSSREDLEHGTHTSPRPSNPVPRRSLSLARHRQGEEATAMDAVRWAQHTALFLVLPLWAVQLQLPGTRSLLWAPGLCLGTTPDPWHQVLLWALSLHPGPHSHSSSRWTDQQHGSCHVVPSFMAMQGLALICFEALPSPAAGVRRTCTCTPCCATRSDQRLSTR